MKSKHIKLIIFLFVSIIFFLFLQLINIYNISTNNEIGIKENMPWLTGPGTNTISYGLFDENNQLINTHELDTLDGKYQFTFSLSNFIEIPREYMLLILVDFKQYKFEVDGKEKKSHTFLARPNETKNILFNIEIPKHSKELAVLIIKNPYKIIKDTDKNKLKLASSLQDILCLRYSLNNTNLEFSNTLNPLSISTNTAIDDVFLSENNRELKVTLNYPNNKPLFLHIGSFNKKETPVAIIAFKNWEQIPINGNLINFTKASNKMKVFQINDLDKGVVQILTFPKPFNVKTEDYDSQKVHSSFRVNLN